MNSITGRTWGEIRERINCNFAMLAGQASTAVHPRQFGSDPGNDETQYIQAAINEASKTGKNSVFFDSRRYFFTRLYGFYHPELNPGYSQNPHRHGRISLAGGGRLDLAHLRDYRPNFGTILESTASDKNAVVFSSVELGHDAQPYPNRQVAIKDISIVANTPGFAVEIAGGPESHMDNVAILQRNKNGSGVDFHSAWLSQINNSVIIGASDDSSVGGTGLRLGTTAPAGVFKIGDCSLIDSFYDGVLTDGGVWAGLSIRDSALQNNRHHQINIQSRILQATFDSLYFEGSRASDIAAGDRCISLLKLTGSYFYNGSQTESIISGPNIDLETVEAVSVDCCHVARPFGSFLHINGVQPGFTGGRVQNCMMTHDNTEAIEGTVDLFTGVVPSLENIIYTGMGSNPKIRLFQP